MKILIVRFSSIGDIILTTPVIRCVKEQVPNSEVHFVTKKAYVGLLDGNPSVDKVFGLTDNFSELAKSLKQEKYDYLVDLHNNLRTKRLTASLRVKHARVDKLNFKKWLLVKWKKNKLPDKHIVERYLDVAKPLNVKNDNKGLDYFIPDNTSVEEHNLPSRFYCYAIGGQHSTKKMPNDKIIELVKGAKLPVVLIGGKEDIPSGEMVAGSTPNAINLCGKLSIAQSALTMKLSEWVITHDTGMMHIAAALKLKIVSIWGNTVPEFGMTPYKPDKTSKLFEVKDLACRPCSKIGFESCPKGHFQCMQNQNTKAMLDWVEGLRDS